MNQVDRVKALCKKLGIPISKLERECGFANGYIGQLKKGTIPADRLEKISNFLGVDIHYFLDNEPAVVSGLSPGEAELLRLFRLLNKSGQIKALEALEDLSMLAKYTSKNVKSSISSA